MPLGRLRVAFLMMQSMMVRNRIEERILLFLTPRLTPNASGMQCIFSVKCLLEVNEVRV